MTDVGSTLPSLRVSAGVRVGGRREGPVKNKGRSAGLWPHKLESQGSNSSVLNKGYQQRPWLPVAISENRSKWLTRRRLLAHLHTGQLRGREAHAFGGALLSLMLCSRHPGILHTNSEHVAPEFRFALRICFLIRERLFFHQIPDNYTASPAHTRAQCIF